MFVCRIKHPGDGGLAGTWVALAAAGGVLAYFAGLRGLRPSLAEFAACAALLLAALALLTRPGLLLLLLRRPRCPAAAASLLPLLRASSARLLRRTRERFDSMAAISGDLLTPQLDRMITALSGSRTKTKPRPQDVGVDAVYLAALPGAAKVNPADADAVMLQYKRINVLLCRMSEAAPDRYAALMTALRAPPPVMVTPSMNLASEMQSSSARQQSAAAASRAADARAGDDAYAAYAQNHARQKQDSDATAAAASRSMS